MDELVAEFLTETNEGLEELDLDMVKLEQNPNDKDLLGKIFRLVHTIKGTCGFLGLPRLEKVAHHGENVLGRFRDGDLQVTPEYVTLIFESLDRIKYIVREIEDTGGEEPEGDDSELIARLDEVYEGKTAGTAPPPDSEAPKRDLPVGMVSEEELEAAFAAAETLSPDELKSTKIYGETGTIPSPAEEDAGATATPPPAPAKPVAASPASDDTQDTTARSSSVSDQTLRVNVDVLENLMTMVSELVLTRNQLLQILRTQSDSEFGAPLQRLNQIVSELQEGVMKTRMQPIGKAWAKLPRIIRDLSMELGKKINLEMRGQDTELDRQVLDLIKDPLTHMVRNSGDHGIEMPADRLAVGKPETGKILLNAFHEGGHIIIRISDDGKGLSTDKIKKKIVENGLASAEELEEMPTQQIQQFIFKAGFSTAEKVTSVSGRGVGMDVVRTNIEKIGGSIELRSEEGKGSTFTIKIPLTLAIVSALIVEAGKERFAIPQLAVRELVMASANGENRIEMIKGTPVFRLRDSLLPLVSLPDLLKLSSKDDAPQDAEGEDNEARNTKRTTISGNSYIVVTHVGSYQFGIIVDKVFDTEEIVVKPVANILRDIEIFSGNTILGDGSVIMILDPNGIAKQTGDVEGADNAADSVQDLAHDHGADKISLLLFKTGDNTPKAVPLSLVARLEHVKASEIEHSGGQMMVQYRGELMPLIPFDSSIQINGDEDLPLLVFSDRGKSLGLIVGEIIDITEERINIQLESTQEGLMGSAIIDDKATDVVDVGHFLRHIDPQWFKNHGDEPYDKNVTNGTNGAHNGSGRRKVLLVDDSPFFRNMLTPLLSVAGYEVTSLESAQDALAMCEKGASFDVIVSDIEMPGMDGFEFAQKVKSDSNWSNTPMVALSSHATPQDIDRGMQVGFNKYVAKFDRNTLLDTLLETLSDDAVEARRG